MIAICSAMKEALIGVDIDGKKGQCNLDPSCKHSENILPKLDSLLEELGTTLADNDVYAVVVGPGSFTGIRIGISLVKGFCAGKDLPVLPLSSLGLMAYSYCKHNKPKEGFCVVMNALSGLYFFARFDKEGNMIGKEELIKTEDLGKEKCVIVSLADEKLTDVSVLPTAEELLEYAEKERKKKNFVQAKELQPIYLRKSQAEVSLEQKKVKIS